MTYEDKLKQVLKAIIEARKSTRKGFEIKLYYTPQSSLYKININEVHDILLKLQFDHKAIFLSDIPTKIKPIYAQTNDLIDKSKDYFLIKVPDIFDSWYSKFLIDEKKMIVNLSKANFDNVVRVTSLIEEELEISQSEKVAVNFVSSIHELEGCDSNDIAEMVEPYFKGLNYLKNIGVVLSFTAGANSVSSEITLNVPKFFEVLDIINNMKPKTLSFEQEETNLVNQVTKEPQEEEKVSYSENEAVVSIKGQEVKLQKDSFRTNLMAVLLKNDKNKRKKWSWDEIVGDIEGVKDLDILKEEKKKFYPACDGIAKFIAQKTGINDLLIFNKSTVQINPKYV